MGHSEIPKLQLALPRSRATLLTREKLNLIRSRQEGLFKQATPEPLESGKDDCNLGISECPKTFQNPFLIFTLIFPGDRVFSAPVRRGVYVTTVDTTCWLRLGLLQSSLQNLEVCLQNVHSLLVIDYE